MCSAQNQAHRVRNIVLVHGAWADGSSLPPIAGSLSFTCAPRAERHLAIRFGEPRPSTLVARKLLDTRIVTVASPAYLKKAGRPIHPAELNESNHRLIDFRDLETGRGYQWAFRQGRKEIEINSNARLLLNDIATLHAVCLAGYGIAQLLELGIESLIENGRLGVIFPDWLDEQFPLFVLHPSRNYLSPKTRAFLDFVIATVKSRT